MTQKRQVERGGYVLIMTVMTMALVVLFLVGIANHSLGLATEAVLQEKALQKRWKSISCQHAILKNARSILRYDELEQKRAIINRAPESATGEDLRRLSQRPSRLEFNVIFNGTMNRMVLADESCKINLLKVKQLKSREHVSAVVIRFAGRLPIDVSVLSNPMWESWGQFFDLTAGQGGRAALWTATESITLWGDGNLNARQCSDDVLAESLALVVLRSESRQIVETRQEFPYLKFADVLERTEIDEDSKAKLLSWMVNDSTSFSLYFYEPDGTETELHVASFFGRSPQFISFVW